MRRGFLALALAGVTPAVAQPPQASPTAMPVPPSWPGAADAGQLAPAATYARTFADPRLTAIITQALAHNQDVALALANIEAARARYRITHAGTLPQIDLGAGTNHAGGAGTLLGGQSAAKGDVFSADGALAAYEVDLFGRTHALAGADRARFLAAGETARATRLSLVADVANAWLAYGADASLLAIAKDTANAARASVALTAKRVAGGIAPLSDERQAELTLHTAEGDVARATAALGADMDALRLLAGGEVAAGNLPASAEDAAARIATLDAGTSSAVLLRRPDVSAAELALGAAQLDVRAARAALFPRITLTGLVGVASAALSHLFTGGAFAWGAGGGINWPLFNGGASKAAVKLAEAQREAALAQYRKSIESAFRDVADGLAHAATSEAELAAAHAEADAAADNDRLATRRYSGGVASYLDKLTADQALYAARRALVGSELSTAQTRVSLYRALGNDPLVESTTPAAR